MATVYCCRECGTNLNLHGGHLFPPDFYFEAGNKNTLSFSSVDSSKFSCGKLVGYIYDDGPPLTDSNGQLGFGPSQVVPRNPRYRFKNKALAINSQT
ncbi:UNVERIFIED_CONTAM: hypothetical protein Sradi_5115000 [Sesamum radiatum]|uniref:CENP-V/GFA domain-containing protein n=1 Tax=Sesamum radiatum TaxID=300843 RepID=A0AAW2M1M0_SESRA